MLEKITEIRKTYEHTIAQLKRDKKAIFSEIDKAIVETKSEVPVPIEKSNFLKRYLQIKEKYN